MISVLIPISPIPSHPETVILDDTIRSIRHHLPDSELHLMFDGVRAEQAHMKADYDEAVRRTLWTADRLWKGCVPYVFDTHLHQVGMLRRVVPQIDTDLMLFCEQDTPLYTSETIDWQACSNFIRSGEADVVRFYHESQPPKEHKHLMRERRDGFQRTIQFSARPHLASTAYYRRVLHDHFSPNANTFTEDVLHSTCQSWPDEHKLWIYAPEGTWLRSHHLDGRAGGPKFDDTMVF